MDNPKVAMGKVAKSKSQRGCFPNFTVRPYKMMSAGSWAPRSQSPQIYFGNSFLTPRGNIFDWNFCSTATILADCYARNGNSTHLWQDMNSIRHSSASCHQFYLTLEQGTKHCRTMWGGRLSVHNTFFRHYAV